VLAEADAGTVTIDTNITAIPAPGGTNSQGIVTGWNAGTLENVKFNVTDAGGTSTITINGSAYTSGDDYTITGAGILTIIVTTVEAGKTPAVRTFTVTVQDTVPPVITQVALHDVTATTGFGDEVGDSLRITFSEAMKDTDALLSVADLEALLTFSGGTSTDTGSNFNCTGLTISFTNSTTLEITVTDASTQTTDIIGQGGGDIVEFGLLSTANDLEDLAGNDVSSVVGGFNLVIGTYTP
jgi:hypothetical protein